MATADVLVDEEAHVVGDVILADVDNGVEHILKAHMNVGCVGYVWRGLGCVLQAARNGGMHRMHWEYEPFQTLVELGMQYPGATQPHSQLTTSACIDLAPNTKVLQRAHQHKLFKP